MLSWIKNWFTKKEDGMSDEIKRVDIREEDLIREGESHHEGIKSETNWGAAVGIITAIVAIVAKVLGYDIDWSTLPEFLDPVALPAFVSLVVTFAVRLIVNWINKKIKK